jgi:hypothetical protein
MIPNGHSCWYARFGCLLMLVSTVVMGFAVWVAVRLIQRFVL